MSSRQEIAPRRRNNVSQLKGRRRVVDWSEVPQYDRLPDWALLDLGETSVLTGLSRTAIEKRIKEGNFPKPRKHGQNRVWPLGEVRQWCISGSKDTFTQHRCEVALFRRKGGLKTVRGSLSIDVMQFTL